MNFYKVQIDYLRLWLKSADGTQKFDWCSLKTPVTWNDVQESVEFITEKVGHYVWNKINRDDLFNEIISLNGYFSHLCPKWNEEKSTPLQRWTATFSHVKEIGLIATNMKLLVELILCLPGTNAQAERYFSMAFNTWGNDKGNMNVKTFDSLMTIKFNSTLDCKEFYAKVQNEPEILRKVLSSAKYSSS